jgi:uncharacterized protein (DUF2249 family)
MGAQDQRIMADQCMLIKPTTSLQHFDAEVISQRFRDTAMFEALNALNPGDVLRYQDVEAPFSLIRKLVITFGAKIEMSYIKRSVGSVVIDFMRR